MKRNYIYFIISLCLVAFAGTSGLSSCKKPLTYATGNLSFSADTVIFDTVFTTIGSTTLQLKIYNNDSKTLKIDQIELEGGTNSPFRINVDGLPGTNFSEIELEGNDSLFVFVEVTLDPNNQNNPMVIEDRIRFNTNGTDQFVQLVAWGQDAYFHYSYISQGQFNFNSDADPWLNDKPHVIYGGAFIVTDETLTIPAGTNIYLHKDAYLYNYQGTLNIEGELGNEVTFQGDRLEAAYDDVSGQYFGIYFNEAKPSSIDYAIIKNGISGIHIVGQDPANPSYTVEVSNTIVENCASYGITVTKAASVKVENSVFAKNGVHALFSYGASGFNFNHCNLLGYGIGDNPAVGISNYYVEDQTAYLVDITEGVITNSAIYGDQAYELAFDTLSDPANTMNLEFEYNNIKSDDQFTNSFYQNNLWNADPVFKNIEQSDFSFWGTSAHRNAGSAGYPITNSSTTNADILNITRLANQPDIGAYEF